MVLNAAKVSVFIKPFGSTKPNDENKFLLFSSAFGLGSGH